MKGITGYDKVQLIKQVCEIEIENMDDINNWELQGRIMFLTGICEIEAKYPRDTYVGSHRLDGWKKEEIEKEQH